MRTLLKIIMQDTNAGNLAIEKGSLKALFEQFQKMARPETSFFYTEDGSRTAAFIFDLADASQIVQIAEPFYMALNARVEFFPIMSGEDLNRGLEAWHKQSKSHGPGWLEQTKM